MAEGNAAKYIAAKFGGLSSEVGYDLAKSAKAVYQLATDANARKQLTGAISKAVSNPRAVEQAVINAAVDFSKKSSEEKAETLFKLGLGSLASAGIGKVVTGAGGVVAKGVSTVTRRAAPVAGEVIGNPAVGAASRIQTPTLGNAPTNLFGACFVAGTLVATKEGMRAIEEIRAGDMVPSRHEVSGIDGWRMVEKTFVHEDRPIVRVTFADARGREESVTATSEHPFYVQGAGWCGAGELRTGDRLVSRQDGREVNVVSVANEGARATVYNFSVAEFHTYFVGELGIWVHNVSSVKEALEQMARDRAAVGNSGNTVVTRTVGRNTADYTLDAQGNTLSAKGSLFEDFGGGSRSSAEVQAQLDAAARGTPGDQGGHIVGYRFLPEQGDINLFPQEGNFNMGAYKTLENDYARYVNEGYQVDFEHTLGNFDPLTGRPATINVEFTVRDSTGSALDSFGKLFDNAPGQTYVRRMY